MTLARPLIRLALALLMGVTSFGLASARAQSPAVGTVVICTGTGPVHILVDENGQPTGNTMICPDYAVAFFAEAEGGQVEIRRFEVWSTVAYVMPSVTGVVVVSAPVRARGPPAIV